MSPTTPSLRVGFAGTPEFAREALAHILAAGFTVPLVLTQPDRPAGRGMKLQPSAVKQLALQHALPVAQPTSLKLDGRWPEEAAAAQQALLDARLDVLVVAAYGLILPRWTLTLPPLGCLNIHGSLLPRWRGAAPIHRAIEAGDAQTGITIMQMDEGLDTGDMLLTATEPILAHDTTATLHDRLASCGGTLIVQALQALDTRRHPLPATPQPAEGVNYAHKIDKREAALDWTLPAEVLARRIRAFDPFPGAHFSRGADSLKVWQAEVVPANTSAPTPPAPGEVLSVTPEQIVVACGPDHQGRPSALALRALQRPGGRRQPVREFLQACALHPGERLG